MKACLKGKTDENGTVGSAAFFVPVNVDAQPWVGQMGNGVNPPEPPKLLLWLVQERQKVRHAQ